MADTTLHLPVHAETHPFPSAGELQPLVNRLHAAERLFHLAAKAHLLHPGTSDPEAVGAASRELGEARQELRRLVSPSRWPT